MYCSASSSPSSGHEDRSDFASVSSSPFKSLGEAKLTGLANMQETVTIPTRALHVNGNPKKAEESPSNKFQDVPEMLIGSGSLSARKHKCLVKSCSDPGASFGRDKMAKQRKSVSFDHDVMVYLFDQVPLSTTAGLLDCQRFNLDREEK